MHKFKTINQARLLARNSIRINTIKWLEAAAEDGFTKDKNILDLKKIKIISSLIYLNMCPLHADPFSNLLYFLGISKLAETLK